MKARVVRKRTLKIPVSESELGTIIARVPSGMELSAWLRSVALGEVENPPCGLALLRYATDRELCFLMANLEAVIKEAAACKAASPAEWLVAMYRVKEAALEAVSRDRGVN
jgi:hypothetical protein